MFTFQQFEIRQESSAMKVCTDSCLFGAWVAQHQAGYAVVDIGTGTGLLALMLAQAWPLAHITGLEIDPGAAREAQYNVSQSPWRNRLSILERLVQNHHPPQGYDTLVSNPPFFENHLASPDAATQQARHQESLSLEDLAQSASRLASPSARLFVLLPSAETQQLAQLLTKIDWHLAQQVHVYTRPKGKHLRDMSLWTLDSTSPFQETHLNIRTAEGRYSPEFRTLLEPYYLDRAWQV